VRDGERGGVGPAGLSDDLRAALREWPAAVEAVRRSGDAHELRMLSLRGRRLAARAAEALGRPVEFVDPVSGALESISGDEPPALLAEEPPAPVPWGTGLTIAAFFAVLAAIADIVLADAFAGSFGLLWVPANLLVTAGVAPSLWLARNVAFWRWPAFGAAAGLGAAWAVLLLRLLG
jgi:Protein of unknown function (DUF2537)